MRTFASSLQFAPVGRRTGVDHSRAEPPTSPGRREHGRPAGRDRDPLFHSRALGLVALWVLAFGCSDPHASTVADGARDGSTPHDGSPDATAPDGSSDSGAVGPLSWTTRLQGLLDGSGPNWEQARDVVYDDQGAIYVVGGTPSDDFFGGVVPNRAFAHATGPYAAEAPTYLGAQGEADAFVVKIDASGAIVWGTFLGGPFYDRAYAVEVDDAHNVYVAGRASRYFPTTSGALDETFLGDTNPNSQYGLQDGFVTKLDSNGSIVWSTYLGDDGPGIIRDIDVDRATGEVRVAAVMSNLASRYFTAASARTSRMGLVDVYFARLAADGGSILYGSYVGGNDGVAYAPNPSVRVLDDGGAYVLSGEPGAGACTGVSGGFDHVLNGPSDMLLTRFSSGGAVVFCAYVGGAGDEGTETHSLAVTPSGDAVIAAGTTSSDFPVTTARPFAGGGSDAFVAVVSADGSGIAHATYFGGSNGDTGDGVSVDSSGRIYVSGNGRSTDLPVTDGSTYVVPPVCYFGGKAGFAAVFAPDLALLHASYVGNAQGAEVRGSALGPNMRWALVGTVGDDCGNFSGDAFAGYTGSHDHVVTGNWSAFLVELAPY